jgi:signal transduction histidine kinase
VASASKAIFRRLKSSYSFYAVLIFFALWATSYNDYDEYLDLRVRLGFCLMSSALLLLAKFRPVMSLIGLALLSLLIGWIAPSLASIEILVVVAIFLVSWQTNFSLIGTMLIGVSAISGMYWLKLNGEHKGGEISILLQGLLVSGLGVGFGSQTRRLRVANERLVKLADADKRNAVVEERRRIARELHDVAAHHLSAVVVKSKLALRLDTHDDLRVANEFASGSATEALSSMRNLVGVLSEVDEAVPLAPQPRLDELLNIKRRMESAGLAIDLQMTSALPPLSRQVELAVVRIVQEALTNVLRHRGPGQAWVNIGLDSVALNAMLNVMVDDDGAAPAVGENYMTGHGLLSMQERATSCGGLFKIGRSPQGGWRVAAALPSGMPTALS